MDIKPLYQFFDALVSEKAYGSITVNFEAGEVKAVHNNLVLKMNDIQEAFAGSGPASPAADGVRRVPAKKRLVIRSGGVLGNGG